MQHQHRLLVLAILTLLIIHSLALASSYWQQEVNYRMDITLASDLRTITGTIDIQYINNSPDTLRVLYFKAFPNAVQKGSYADLAARRQNDYSMTRLTQKTQGSLTLVPIPERTREGSVRSIQSPPFEIDNSIITVTLYQPLLPSDTVNLKYGFKTILPDGDEMRMGRQGGVTKAAYWYPQVCVYDRKLGWNNGQYIGWGECYGDYGKFDVTITAPTDQIVAATGVLVNESEALPDSLRRLYDLSNYLKPKADWPKFHFDSTAVRKWHYVAEKVPDFVFTCSNNWCIDTSSYNGVQIVAYALRHKAKGWKETVRLGRETLQTYGEKFLPYQWPVIRICDAFSGMEYPMLTNCGGEFGDPGFYILAYHEIGHQWFMGMIGSNQTDRPFLDEGFNTFGEHVTMEKYLGRNGNMNHFRTWYQKTFAPSTEDRDDRGFRPLMLLIQQGMDKPMVFSYDQGEEYWPWRVSAYYKCAAMHYALRSLLGDSAYFAAMHYYCKQWLFKHPYEDDFTASMEQATGLKLDSYLKQWYYSRNRLDYAVDGVSSEREDKSINYTIKLRRPGKFVSSIDIAVIWEQGDTSLYTVAPEGMAYTKPGYRLLPTWDQFRRYSDTYQFTIRSERQIKKVVIDPDNTSIDINRPNNSTGFLPPIETRLDNMKFDRIPVNQYALRWRPDLWYDQPNGAQVGFHAHGSYLGEIHKFSLDTRVGTKSGRGTIDFSYSNPFTQLGSMSSIGIRTLWSDYRTFIQVNVDKTFKRWYSRPDRLTLRFDHSLLFSHPENSDRTQPLADRFAKYLPDPNWEMSRIWISQARAGWLKTFHNGVLRIEGNSQALIYGEMDQNRSSIEDRINTQLQFTNRQRTWLELNGGFNFTFGRPPSQFVRQLSRARSVDAFLDSKVFRSPGSFPTAWQDDFYLSGGPVRGYQDRPIWFFDAWHGSLELTPPDLLPYRWLRKFPLVGGFLSRTDQSIFVDFAAITMQGGEYEYRTPIDASETDLSGKRLRAYTSAGLSLNFPPIWSQQHVRLDFPLYLSRPAPGDNEFAFRFSAAWILPLKW